MPKKAEKCQMKWKSDIYILKGTIVCLRKSSERIHPEVFSDFV